MFDPEFFPTPKALVQKMLGGYVLPEAGCVLEPSAGKGDILDAIPRKDWRDTVKTSGQMAAIEINPELQGILRAKGYRVLGSDFMAYHERRYWNLIIMNPPFSKAAEHLLHAYDIQLGGYIVCLCPLNMIQNPHTHTHLQLRDLLANTEAQIIPVEGAPFMDAERKTRVAVCIVRIHKQDTVESTFDFGAVRTGKEHVSGTEAPALDADNSIAIRDNIGRIVAAYQGVLRQFAPACVPLLKLHSFGQEFGDSLGSAEEHITVVLKFCECVQTIFNHGDYAIGYRDAYNTFTNVLRAAAWKQVLSKTELTRYMTKSVLADFEKFKAEQDFVEFSEENIYRLLETLAGSTGSIMQKAVEEAFDELTKYHDENRVYFEGWKTNDCWRVNRKFILPRMVEPSWGGGLTTVYDAMEKLSNLDRALCMLEGIKFESITDTYTAIQTACMAHERTGSSTFFDFKVHLKGTGHFVFRDEDIWARFNKAACKAKNWLPPAKGGSR